MDLSLDFETGKRIQKIDYETPDCHGTRCAGQIVGSGFKCGIGVSFNSKISSLRLLVKGVAVAPEVEVAAITRKNQEIDIYNCSWGPPDDGKIVDGPSKIVMEAFIDSSLEGRGGKGNIFVFASGNGGRKDDCNLDGYANSLFSLTVGSIGDMDSWPSYMEPCSAQWATLYGSTDKDSMIYTSDLNMKCTDDHGGTSAAAPLMSGIIALSLSLRPDLTWRDIRYLLVKTCKKPSPIIPERESSWILNAVGIEYSRKFGFGKVDAKAFVQAAKDWKSVSPSTIRRYKSWICNGDDGYFGVGDDLAKHIVFDINLEEYVKYKINDIINLEQVLIRVNIRHSKRGSINISLTSPSGTTLPLLSSRPSDTDNSISGNGNGLNNWTLMSLGFWGEDIRGTWSVIVETDNNCGNCIGNIFDITISFYGSIDPFIKESNYSFKEMVLESYFGLIKGEVFMEMSPKKSSSPTRIHNRITFSILAFIAILALFIIYICLSNIFF